MSIHQITYRKDIDGLRALAILSVISYHTFPNIFIGGFVGVDIFFVISGFLITRIILENLERNSFSFIEFYNRRIRRLFPALFLILLTCLVFGWFALYASEYKRLSEHVAAGAGFFQNFVLMKEIGYFEKSIDTKPLVHLWSLSIEEQFYICWPVILWVLFKKKLNITGFLLLFLGVSLLVNINTIQQNQITTFYSPLSRCWELIVGAVWASMLFKDPKIGNFNINTLNILSLTGSLLLLIAVFTIDGTKLFPGYWALLPTFGAIFLIAANENGVVNRTLLSHPLMTWFGQISYPLYLWHWILLSFGQIITANKLAGLEKIILISCSFVFAYLTNRYWENLLRYKGNKVTLCLLIGVIFIGLQGWNFYQRDGLEFRHKYVTDLYGGRPAQTDKQCLNRFATHTPGFCRMSDDAQYLDVVLIGDSFAHNAYSGLASKYTYFGKNFAMVGWPGHQPLLKEPDESNYESFPAKSMNKLIVNLANDRDIKTVILTMRQPEVNPIIKKQLIRTVQFFEENGKKVIFIYPPPVLTFEPIECIGFPPLRPKLNEECIQYVKDIDPQYFIGRIELQNVINHLTISSYDTYPQLCQENKCQIKNDDSLVYRQKGYFTVEGSKKAFQKFKE